ncbi:M56 family peptidase [Hyunsoonleella flava]|uniref:M56 family peptidase n=1 Tax=Hyunsoonleella flava TaxID=2527939 RepID=A0A4V2J9U8_9FLAO|nr:M56 family metallopeptidase [Hyunsoonleella flava]TBN00403.1 M56 family peptidase [Hyunsoonleella flava]
MEYILKASGVVAIFYVFYLVLLRKDTFFKWNRLFLLVGLVSAFLLSLVVIPIYIEYTPIDISSFTFETAQSQQAVVSYDVLDYLALAYFLGVTYFFLRFVLQLFSLIRVIWNNKRKPMERFVYVETQQDISPFSFFKWIVYNPNQFNPKELQQILAHEKVHVEQHHSIDVLLMQVFCIVLWFNPFVWLYSKSLTQNLEFLADSAAVDNSECKKSYQYTLLKTSLPTHQLALSNNFYNSLIKKRIVMLHKSKSNKLNQLKFLLITPLLVLFLMSFSTKEIYIKKDIVPVYELQSKVASPVETIIEQKDTGATMAKTNENIIAEKRKIKGKRDPIKTNSTVNRLNKKTISTVAATSISTSNITKPGEEVIIITKNTSDEELENIATNQKKLGLDLKFSGVKRNKDGEITAIKIEASTKRSNANYNIKDDDAINPIMISYSDGNISIGNAKSKHNTFVFESEDNNNKTVSVIVEADEDIDEDVEEDIIVIKEKSNGKEDKRIINIEKKSKMIVRTKDGTQPLFIVDGKELKRSKFKNLEPDDIEKIYVLKGDSATEKYGDKGKNGVVEVITKKKK